ncbi:MAG: ATP synthase F1 subunit epsilon [Bacteroidales bacterium]|jgi:F-type H+-transporting ATPase subunit epsilon|nr:ATP synthase F1 subunit epsilon [Bacteroidales bacterium]
MMQLHIITPERTIFTGEVSLVQLPGIDGLFEILNNHAPLIATLREGKIKTEKEGNEQFFEIKGGIAEILENCVLVLAE